MKQLLTIFLGLLAFNSVKADRSATEETLGSSKNVINNDTFWKTTSGGQTNGISPLTTHHSLLYLRWP